MIIAGLFAAALFLAYANGANDNFKGVATLYGSNAASYRTALTLATIATVAGSLASVFLAQTLIKAFSGKGLVPDAVAASPEFLMAVALGAAITVMLATRFGFPISTTHALTGALTGSGFVTAGSNLDISVLGTAFFLPLLISPILAVVLTMPLYALAHKVVDGIGLEKESCVCVGPRQFVPVARLASGQDCTGYCDGIQIPAVTTGTMPDCVSKYSGQFLGISAQSLVDGAHHASAAAVCFARGLNDTPKIAGLLLVLSAFDIKLSMVAIAAIMALGGIIAARRVAETMSKKISKMNDGQALTANLVTAALVIGASRIGVPVSTTHVSVGAITGVGLVNGSASRSVLSAILMSWLLTLPVAALIAGLVSCLLRLYA